ncbi:MAG: type II toxin-antitoxin system RelE/ParE family toxin [Hyphomicrobiales bacterium]|nr:type II toxin-antitoxin system RelE/ParE family toxin [Hyphomicrobiales bacterium]
MARRDLRDAAAFVARHNPRAARALRDKVLLAVKRIAEFPMQGVVRRELAPADFRFLVLSGVPYVIVYTIGDPIRIIRVMHTARNHRVLVAGQQ